MIEIRVVLDHNRTDPEVEALLNAIVQGQVRVLSFNVTVPGDGTLWRVMDNVTGRVVSREFDNEDAATAVCREFNTPASSGGRYYVEVFIEEEWRRYR